MLIKGRLQAHLAITTVRFYSQHSILKASIQVTVNAIRIVSNIVIPLKSRRIISCFITNPHSDLPVCTKHLALKLYTSRLQVIHSLGRSIFSIPCHCIWKGSIFIKLPTSISRVDNMFFLLKVLFLQGLTDASKQLQLTSMHSTYQSIEVCT